ncbi:MAG: PIN domain-containing protein [Oscillospiraceae bacterium]|jgi:tRNA(fMet)-specific endonuclease VapC|nr:PIN domain-containing protein [Oscillospiraceae bacterium]
MTYALDTNVISGWLSRNMQIIEKLSDALRQGHTIVIPPVVYYELRRGFKHRAVPGKERAFALICQSCEIGEMTIAAWETAADIYAQTRKAGFPIDDGDILISAFCVVNNYILITYNTRHFERIEGLRLGNWV